MGWRLLCGGPDGVVVISGDRGDQFLPLQTPQTTKDLLAGRNGLVVPGVDHSLLDLAPNPLSHEAFDVPWPGDDRQVAGSGKAGTDPADAPDPFSR